ncbi:LysM peptidoglycan-binding domain-containing M23 family metallopeptidase [Bradyrhizobium japonicum]|uniref:LysM peptidoglycan-binding domain-containing M23 family metallopeptidase n=1 Tax=Bradyrhizobium japonicum TaxID=375 RepID=UPI001BA4E0F2|nr:LysM peptidoglycan-binding domain-containing M23 family metallopeptidase [Bradyrhizobium japonicum]MBR0910114.1 LysM peptidoglycan-binding domain-containing M23 family metallopeptidase [Bradyrhizobium japonicum]MCP1765783.1 murein DD-endopeptidase MepM/ murein hydrolase activator NlpD [Bradyrhizobium japonicum]MCP1787920.1 murein DD-endopeptidase MepM/ murein hydrolase activator NlpD [Bradyrhizobium japonicum]MCP1809796.1 murein DD-endopeptidase MepM/ murein hydrolase activator NlpD [Bradyrh
MSIVAELLYSRRVPQVAVLALISFSFAGCSADMSSRLSQSNFSNPFSSDQTGSVQQAPPPQRELPQYSRPQTQPGYYQSQPLPPPAVSAPQSYPVTGGGGVSGGGRGVSSYAPPAQPHLETTATVPPRSVAAAQPAGGTKIIVGTSDTLDVLAKRYRVTPQAILAANGYKGPRALSPGQQLIIPHPATAAAPAPAMAPVAAAPAMAPAAKPVAAVVAPSSTHFVNHGDTLASIARKNHISSAELARANGLDPSAKLKLGTRLTVPGAKTAAVAAPVAAAPVAGTLQPVAVAPAPATKMAAVAAPVQSARLAQATTNVEEKAAEAPAKAAETTSALPTFRWPVRGKVVTSYGAKTNGKSNDGINLAVPEGTPVKAAEDGVVAYSGNELKGYGNLVLVRHSNGYVTAYAHASELMVKRGDTIKRGQVIAKSGQSGEVASPQLHFEIRKGSSPVDPLQFLNGA